MLAFLIIVAYPMVYGIAMSFFENVTLNSYVFVGLDNFKDMFSSSVVLKSLKNNLIYPLMVVPGTICLSLLISELVFRLPRGGGIFRNTLFLPHITSGIAVATIWKVLFLPDTGLINMVLKSIGIASPPRWLASTTWALPSIAIVAIWQAFGFSMLFFLAGLQGIPKEMYEAGELDGAIGFKRFLYITFPMLTPTIFFVTVTNIIGSFKVFDLILMMTNGGPANATNVMVYQIYKAGIVNLRYGYASAISLVLFAIILLITFIQMILEKKWVFYGE